MTRTQRSRIVALAMLALLAGLPGLLQAGCPDCQASKMERGPHCRGEGAAVAHAACCGPIAWTPAVACCAEMAAAEPGLVTRAAVAPAPLLALVDPAAVPVAAVRQDDARAVRLADRPPLPEGVPLHVLHSAFLI